MFFDLTQVPTGSTLGDMTHKGIRQGGNKSMLSYRNDIGVPGYTGFNPSGSCIPMKPKGNTVRTGKIPDKESLSRAVAETNNLHTHSMYRTCHTSLSPEEYRAMSMHGNTMHQQDEGGYWIEKASLPGPPRRFTARSTYQEELLDGVNTAAKTYAKTADMSITTCPFFEGTRRSGQDFVMSSSRPIRTAPAALQTQKGDMIGYTTMYKSMVLKDPLTGGTAAPGGPRMPSQEPSTRARVLPHSVPSRLEKNSTYTVNFGSYGHDPMTRTAASHKDMTMTSTTHELNLGTTRTTRQVPGYSGFMPASKKNDRAVEHGMGAIPRSSAKTDMLLYSLDQYSRERVPKYLGSRPQANRNIRLDEKPTLATTQGITNHHATKRVPPPVDRSAFIDSNKGTGSFFTDGGTFKSDNGKHESDLYYMSLRPLEGYPQMHFPSQRTKTGGHFTS